MKSIFSLVVLSLLAAESSFASLAGLNQGPDAPAAQPRPGYMFVQTAVGPMEVPIEQDSDTIEDEPSPFFGALCVDQAQDHYIQKVLNGNRSLEYYSAVHYYQKDRMLHSFQANLFGEPTPDSPLDRTYDCRMNGKKVRIEVLHLDRKTGQVTGQAIACFKDIILDSDHPERQQAIPEPCPSTP